MRTLLHRRPPDDWLASNIYRKGAAGDKTVVKSDAKASGNRPSERASLKTASSQDWQAGNYRRSDCAGTGNGRDNPVNALGIYREAASTIPTEAGRECVWIRFGAAPCLEDFSVRMKDSAYCGLARASGSGEFFYRKPPPSSLCAPIAQGLGDRLSQPRRSQLVLKDLPRIPPLAIAIEIVLLSLW